MANLQNRESKLRPLRAFEAIASDEDLEYAVHDLDKVLHKGNYISLLEQLFQRPFLVEIVFHASNQSLLLRQWVLDGASSFPQPDDFVSSFYGRLLFKISRFVQEQLPRLVNLDTDGSNEIITRYARMVNNLPRALEVLSISTVVTSRAHSINPEKMDAKKWNSIRGKRTHQKAQSHSAVVGMKNTKMIDSELFSDFFITFPVSANRGEGTISEVLHTAKSMLEYFLELLCRPVVANAIRKTYLNQVCRSAYPMVQPLKSARHFDNAEGFGEWRILISTRAEGNLREARRKDQISFKIMVKKIKELSNGHFSEDNHKRLSGRGTEVPIFEAKMTRDSRVVYQIDVISDYDYKDERQVIRIFGIYTHAQMDQRLWKSIGLQQGRKGKEYIRRCEMRKPSLNGDKSFFSPACFPAPEEDETLSSQDNFFLPPDDLEQVHSLLVLEKYLTFSRELLHTMLANLDDTSFPFQVSPQERDIIEFPYSCFVLGRSGTGKTTTMLFKMLWREREYQINSDNISKPRQIFVTKSRVLATKVEEYFRKILETLKAASLSPRELKDFSARQNAGLDDDALRDLDEDEWRSDLPPKFSELQDSHFPLFITFERLCDMLEAEFEPPALESVRCKKVKRRGNVSFEVFLNDYWPHFSFSHLTKGLDPALVYSEILGVIKGSEEATCTSYGYLDRKTYETLSERRHSTFASQRSTIYNIFEGYRKRKQERNERDMADRAHSILRMLADHSEQRNRIVKKKVDQLCVDEAQDNLLSDALILRSLCHNPDGLFWAGDTAQTISVGSSFRFDDLKSFLFRVEERRRQSQHAYQAHHAPKTFHLATNYRSHAGIVNCAHSIIELITQFWPYSIDNLAPEKGIVEGLKPVFLHGWDSDSVRYEQFLFGSSGNEVELGAQQCILVRNEIARENLQQEVGEIGVIMTLYESKGLEFDDVLLYNFFEDSSVEFTQWRLILNTVNANFEPATMAPQFDPSRHAVVCNELKFLYVAVTRARKNLWIADQSRKAEPMRMLWTSRNQIQCVSPGMEVPKMAVAKSSQKEWATKGKELFDRKHYLQAKHCFERASMPREVAISNAYLLRDRARKHFSGDARQVKVQRLAAFLEAAECFISCASETQNKIYFRRAAECFEAAEKDLQAAKTYLQAEDYDAAALLFRRHGHFDEAVDVIKAHEDVMDTDMVENIVDVSKLYYFREKQLKKASRLFSSDDAVLEYLKELDLDVAHAEVLESLGRYMEAAELHLSEGRTMEAIPLFLKEHNEMSVRRAAGAILQEFWSHISFASDIPVNSQPVSQLLLWTTGVTGKRKLDQLKNGDEGELRMFKAIINGNSHELSYLAKGFLTSKNTPAAVLCLSHHFKSSMSLSSTTIQELASHLELFLIYIDLLRTFAGKTDPATDSSASRLLGFHRVSADEFFLPTDSFLHLHRKVQQDNKILATELRVIFRSAIFTYLGARVSEEMEVIGKALPMSSPCIELSVHGSCRREDCNRDHPSLTSGWYNLRVRIHLQQILVVHKSQMLRNEQNLTLRRSWINRFYEALHPHFELLGNLSHLDIAQIPEFQKGVQVIRDWVRECAYTLDPRSTFSNPAPFLTRLIRSAILSFSLDKSEALKYWWNARYLQFPVPPFLRPPGGLYILPELIISLEGGHTDSINYGVSSLRHVLNGKIPINVGLLCDWIETLCSSIIVTKAARRLRKFHGVTLPRSWASRRIPSELHQVAHKYFHPLLFNTLFDHFSDLLESIFTGGASANYLLCENGDLSEPRFGLHRGWHIARICKALCLLGYNIEDPGLRQTILKTVTSLNRPGRHFNYLSRRYVFASTWSDLVFSLRDDRYYRVFSLFDGLIQLHDLRGQAVPLIIRGIRVLAYNDESDLERQLRQEVITDENRTEHQGDHFEEFNQANAKEIATDPSPNVEEEELHENDFVGDISAAEVTIPSVEVAGVNEPSESEHAAALTIQKLYRSFLRKRQKIEIPKRRVACRRFFLECLGRAEHLGWELSSRYRFCYLGPLPHLLVCLEMAHIMITEHKKSTKKRFVLASHQELDEVKDQLTRLSTNLKAVTTVQTILTPGAALHLRCDLKALGIEVEKAARLLQNLPSISLKYLSPDLDIAIKGIITPPAPPKKQKPALNIDDDTDPISCYQEL